MSTVDELRTRLRRELARTRITTTTECPRCGGLGTIHQRTQGVTGSEVGAIIGVSRAQVSNSVLGKTDLSLPVGLRLIDWLDAQEATK